MLSSNLEGKYFSPYSCHSSLTPPKNLCYHLLSPNYLGIIGRLVQTYVFTHGGYHYHRVLLVVGVSNLADRQIEPTNFAVHIQLG